MKRLFALSAAVICFTGVFAQAKADSLENLERERAIAISKMLNADISVAQRSEYMMASWRRLTDLEKIVINDKSQIFNRIKFFYPTKFSFWIQTNNEN